MHNVTQFSQRHVIFRNVIHCRNVKYFRHETYRFRYVMLRVSLRHVSFRCCVVSGLCAQRRVIFRLDSMGHGSDIDDITSLSGEYFWRKMAAVQRNAMVFIRNNIDGLVQERRNSIASALELRLSCIGPSIYSRCGFKDSRIVLWGQHSLRYILKEHSH